MTEKTFEEILLSDGSFCWKNVGVSMLPLIKEGKDIIIIKRRPLGRLKKLDVVLFKRPNVVGRGAYVLHRILSVNDDGTYFIIGDNCQSGETVKDENIIGVLDSVSRNGRLINDSRLTYRIYVALWCKPYKMRIFLQKLYRKVRHLAAVVLRKLKIIK